VVTIRTTCFNIKNSGFVPLCTDMFCTVLTSHSITSPSINQWSLWYRWTVLSVRQEQGFYIFVVKMQPEGPANEQPSRLYSKWTAGILSMLHMNPMLTPKSLTMQPSQQFWENLTLNTARLRNQNCPLPITSPSSLPTEYPCLQPIFTRRTSGHYQEIF